MAAGYRIHWENEKYVCLFLGTGPVLQAFAVVCFAHGEGLTGNDERRARKMLGILIGFVVLVTVVIPVLVTVFAALAAVLSGIGIMAAAGALIGEGILPGILIGYVLYRAYQKNRLAETEAE
jgi:hypothetical protein